MRFACCNKLRWKADLNILDASEAKTLPRVLLTFLSH